MRFLFLLALALAPLSLAAREKPQVILEALPAKMAGCDRTEVHTYDEPKYGASIAYRKEGFLVTVYVYDLEQQDIGQKLDDPVLKSAFDTSIAELEEATRQGYYTDVEERDNGTAKFGPGHEVLRARYRLTRAKGAAAGQRAFSEIHVFGAQGYIIKLRVTGSLEDEAAHSKTLEQMIPALMDKLRKAPAKQPARKKVQAASPHLPFAANARFVNSRSEFERQAA
jgi:hypothetical protein